MYSYSSLCFEQACGHRDSKEVVTASDCEDGNEAILAAMLGMFLLSTNRFFLIDCQFLNRKTAAA